MITNSTLLSAASVNEAMKKLYHSFLIRYVVIEIVVLFLGVIAGSFIDTRTFYGFILAAIVLIFVFIKDFKALKARTWRLVKEQYQVPQDFESFESKVEMNDAEIVVSTEFGSRVFATSEVDKSYVSGNYMVLVLKDLSYIFLDEKGYIDCSANELKKLLPGR